MRLGPFGSPGELRSVRSSPTVLLPDSAHRAPSSHPPTLVVTWYPPHLSQRYALAGPWDKDTPIAAEMASSSSAKRTFDGQDLTLTQSS